MGAGMLGGFPVLPPRRPEATEPIASGRRSHPNQRCRKGGHPPFNAFAAGSADPTAWSDCLRASWQLYRKNNDAPGLPGVYSSAFFTPHTVVHDRDPGAYRNATSGGKLIEG